MLGDVSFAHDLGGLLVARAARARRSRSSSIDNGGGRIFDGLPIAGADVGDAFARHFTTAPELDVVAVATALGARAVAARSARRRRAAARRDRARRPPAPPSSMHRSSPTGARDVTRRRDPATPARRRAVIWIAAARLRDAAGGGRARSSSARRVARAAGASRGARRSPRSRGALAIQIGTNFANDVFDAEQRRRRPGPHRPACARSRAGLDLGARAMKRAMIGAFAVATAFGVYLA